MSFFDRIVAGAVEFVLQSLQVFLEEEVESRPCLLGHWSDFSELHFGLDGEISALDSVLVDEVAEGLELFELLLIPGLVFLSLLHKGQFLIIGQLGPQIANRFGELLKLSL